MEGKNMGFESYVSESEAASFAGVSIATLKRFTEAGYFKVETEQDGLVLYPRSELAKVFGIKNPTERLRDFPAWQPPSQAISPESNGVLVAQSAQTQLSTLSQVPASSASDIDEASVVTSSCPTESNLGNVSEQKIEPQSLGANAQLREQVVVTRSASPVTERVVSHSESSDSIQSNERELSALIERQKIVLDMHERLLSMKEERIKSLEDEREWLRARIEKLEEKANRDQLLLLSETQTIKALITIQEQRRSPVRGILEWFGFIAPAPVMQLQGSQASSIDVTNSSNSSNLNK